MSAAVCPQCDGGGEVAWNPSSIGDPQDVMTARCPRCEGEGREPLDDAGVAPDTDRALEILERSEQTADRATDRRAWLGMHDRVELLGEAFDGLALAMRLGLGLAQGPSERLRERVITAGDVAARNTALEAVRRAQAACEPDQSEPDALDARGSTEESR